MGSGFAIKLCYVCQNMRYSFKIFSGRMMFLFIYVEWWFYTSLVACSNRPIQFCTKANGWAELGFNWSDQLLTKKNNWSDQLLLTIVVKIGPNRPVQLVRPGTRPPPGPEEPYNRMSKEPDSEPVYRSKPGKLVICRSGRFTLRQFFPQKKPETASFWIPFTIGVPRRPQRQLHNVPLGVDASAQCSSRFLPWQHQHSPLLCFLTFQSPSTAMSRKLVHFVSLSR